MNTYQNALPHGERHPLTAAFLSIIPGLGQLYVGDKRKGVLFLDVAIINYVLLALVCFSPSIVKALWDFAHAYRFSLNHDLAAMMQNTHPGSPSSFFMVAATLLFIWFAARDAYDKAFGAVKRKTIYRDHIIDFSEATSGSYIIHVSLMLTCLLLAMLFVQAPPKITQKITIDFEMDQNVPVAIKPPKTDRVSTKTVDDAGKRKLNEPPKVTQSAAKSMTKSEQKAEPTKGEQAPDAKENNPTPPAQPAPVKPSTPAPPAPAPQAVLKPITTPAPLPMPHVGPVAAMPMHTTTVPKVTAIAAAAPPVVPTTTTAPADFTVPTLAPSHVTASTLGLPAPVKVAMAKGGAFVPIAVPGALSGMNSTGKSFAPIAPNAAGTIGGTGTAPPGPVSAIPGTTGTNGTGAPHVVAIAPKARSAGCAGCGGTSGHNVSPIRATTGPGSGPDGKNAFAVSPTVTIGPATTGSDDSAQDGNPAKDKTGKPAIATREIDWGPYMAALQKLIKKHWFPPKDTESKRIVVDFKVSASGAMSGLHLARSCGVAVADNAALHAVEDAAPYFKALPQGSPESVDIEFTFDFNVFNGASPPVRTF